MGRIRRSADGGLIYHVLNRANGRIPIFECDEDYEAFERILQEAVIRTGTELLAFCVLHNHWHLVVKPHEDGELSRSVSSYLGKASWDRMNSALQTVPNMFSE
jgi:putative transposase